MVKLTTRLVIATVVLGAVGLLQLVAFGIQARRLKEAVIATKVSSDAYMTGERAWIISSPPEKAPILGVISESRDDPGYGDRNDFLCSFLNRGRTPATIFEIFVQYRKSDTVPENPDYARATPCNILLVPEDSIGITATLNPEAILQEKEWLSINSRKSFVYAFGFVKYRDVYNQVHETRFGYLYYVPYDGDTQKRQFSRMAMPTAYNYAD